MRVCVVGASSGLGAALGLKHRERGDGVVALGRRGMRLAQLGDISNAYPGTWESVAADLTDPQGFTSCVERASTCDRVYLCAASNGDVEETMNLNFIVQARLAVALDRPGLRLVVISSLAAKVAFKEMPHYCASKAALEHWIAGHRQGASASIIVVRPGQFDSEFHTGPRDLRIERLPHERASEVARVADGRSEGTVTLGGLRDRVAAAVAGAIGPVHARRVL